MGQAKNTEFAFHNPSVYENEKQNESMPPRKKADPQAVQRGRLFARLYLFVVLFGKEAIEGMREYISVLEELDPDGFHAIYSRSPKGELYHNEPKFIRVVMLNDALQKVLLPMVDGKS